MHWTISWQNMVLSRRNRELYAQDELRRLREENARLKELLIQHGIAWAEPAIPEPVPAATESAPFTLPVFPVRYLTPEAAGLS